MTHCLCLGGCTHNSLSGLWWLTSWLTVSVWVFVATIMDHCLRPFGCTYDLLFGFMWLQSWSLSEALWLNLWLADLFLVAILLVHCMGPSGYTHESLSRSLWLRVWLTLWVLVATHMAHCMGPCGYTHGLLSLVHGAVFMTQCIGF